MAEMTEKQWLSGVQSSIIKELTTHKAALPAGFNQERFALNTVTVISEMLKDKKKKTELCKLTFESMAVCLCKAAYLGLDYFNGECYAIPYGGELNFHWNCTKRLGTFSEYRQMRMATSSERQHL